MMDMGKQLVIVGITFTITSWLFVLLRCFVRFKIVNSFGADDWLIILSVIISTMFSGFLITSVHHGLGKHVEDLTLDQISNALRYQFYSEPVYVLGALFIKLSVGILLLRITTIPIYRYILWGSMAIMTIWTATAFSVILTACVPLRLSWDPTWTPSSGYGWCLDRKLNTRLSYGYSATDIFFDWAFAILPVPMLWGLQMSKQVKLSLFLILGLGALASTTTLVRLRYLVALEDDKDFVFSIARAVIWSILELNLGTIAACMAALRPLFKNWRVPGFSSLCGKSKRRTGAQTHDYDLGYVGQQSGVNKSSAVYSKKLGDNHTSQESIINHDGIGIQRRVDVDVIYEA